MNEQDSGVEVVRGCLTEEGDSILGAFLHESHYAGRAIIIFHYFFGVYSYTNSRY